MKVKEQKVHPSSTFGTSLIVLSSLAYASYGIWVKLTGEFFGNFTQAVVRGALVALFLLPLALRHNQLRRIEWRRDWALFGGLLISTTFISAPLFYSVRTVGVGVANAVCYTGIILGSFFFGRLFAGEAYTREKRFSTILGLIGLWLIFTPLLDGVGSLGIVAALISGLAAGLNMVINKKLPYTATQTTIITWSATALTNAPFIFLFKEPLPMLALDVHWLYLLLFSISSLTASWLLIRGLKHVEAGVAGILGLLEIVFSVLFGILFFHERLTLPIFTGILFILFAAAIPYLPGSLLKK